MSDAPNAARDPIRSDVPPLPMAQSAPEKSEGTVIEGPFPRHEIKRAEAYLGGASYNFQPSKDVLKRYFSTRKHSFSLAEITFPGLFAEPSEVDLGWFKLAVFIETLTAIVLSAIVVSVYDLPPIAGLLPFLGFVGIDLALAIGHHWPLRRERSLHENQKLLVTPDLRSGMRIVDIKYGDFLGGLNTRLRDWHEWLSRICVFVILAMAIGKTLFLSANIQELGSLFRPANSVDIFASHSSLDQILQRSEYRTAILVIFGLLYSLVAYIHIKHTGYALAGINLVKGLKRDRQRRDSNPRDNQFHCVPYQQWVDLRVFTQQLRAAEDPVYARLLPAESVLRESIDNYGLHVDLTPAQQVAIAPHSIEAKGNATYVMMRVGKLTDDQLQAWVNMQPTAFAGCVVALYGHKLQMNMVGGEDIDEDIF